MNNELCLIKLIKIKNKYTLIKENNCTILESIIT